MSRSSSHPGTPDSPQERRRLIRRQEDLRLRRREREIEVVRRISEALFQHLSDEELVKEALHTALAEVDAEAGCILLANADTRTLVFYHAIGEKAPQAGLEFPWDRGIAGSVFQTGEVVLTANARDDPRHYPAFDDATGFSTHDMIALPLKRWQGDSIGVMEVMNKRGGHLDEEDLGLLRIISSMAASSIERARLYQEAKLAEVARLLGGINHDIKNMLMPVATGADLIEDELREMFEGLPGTEQRKAERAYRTCKEIISMFDTSVHRIQDRVKEISDCVKGLSTEPRFDACHVRSVIEAVLESVRWLAERHGITLSTEGLDHLPEIVADDRRLFNAFYNLVNNAIPEVPAGGSITVRGRADQGGNGIVVSVIDTGRGLPPEIRDGLLAGRVASQKKQGTGLGIKIVKDVVDAHRGTITLESEPGRGTAFHLRLPCDPRRASEGS